ncbi:MAG TPA: bifunctional acetate--CoA ligase family protein/GNAT family N-acetyltransferase [Hyphomonadaceae bacterium]|nr:bifunctional acetate--CoA ligase family protein/GNAT family N-acetyltransferase [Hyphomonadaceae bacterium]
MAVGATSIAGDTREEIETMTTRNLDALFAPKTIALVGASNQEGSVGRVLARNLLEAGFGGRILLVNPRAPTIHSVPSFPSIADLPVAPDLAVIATPPAAIPDAVTRLGERGCRAAVVITAGLDSKLKKNMLEAGRPFLMRIVGPNCLGFISPARGINASFSHLTPSPGSLAFVTQSGAIATSIIDWAMGHGIGFSHLVSLGDMADVDFGDLLDFLALDPETRAILLYAENVTHARKFMSAGRIAARAKPVIVVKAGRSRSGAAAAASHTGALAGADAVYDAAFRRAGMLRVETLRRLFDAAATLASGVRVSGNRLTILTNGGGLGVLAADALESAGGVLAGLAPETRNALDCALPSGWSHANPVDILGDARADRYEAALHLLSDMPGSDALLVMNCPTGVASSLDAAEATVRAKARDSRRPILGCWMGETSTTAPRNLLSGAGIPNYETPDEAVAAFMQLVEYAQNQRALFETPSTRSAATAHQKDAVRDIVSAVLREGRSILTEPEAKMVLAAYSIPTVATRSAANVEGAAQAAGEIGAPVALKILSRDITHKSDVGGVRLNLSGAEETRRAAEAMLNRVMASSPHARIDGFTVQPMIRRPLAQELLLGAVVDPTFGPCIMFGQGGTATEVIADRCIGLPPLNENLARDMIARTRIARLLAGYRDRAPADLSTVAAALVSLSDLMIDIPEIRELDINPLLADGDGVIALDARIIIDQAPATPDRLAIRPYPADLEKRLNLDGLGVRLRPIRPDDASALSDMARRTAAEDLRLRFHGGVNVSPQLAIRLSQIDYDREMVFIAELDDNSIAGVVRLIFDPDFNSAECAILVRTDVQRRTIGRTLMHEAVAYARVRGATRVWGDILVDNARIVDLARRLGATISQAPAASRLVRAEFALSGSA